MLTASKFALFGVFMVALLLLGACEKDVCLPQANTANQSPLNQPLVVPLMNQSPSLNQPPNAPLMYQSPTVVAFNPELLATYTREHLATALQTESALQVALKAGGKFTAVRFGFDKAQTAAGAGNFGAQGKDIDPADGFSREFTFEGNALETNGVDIVYRHPEVGSPSDPLGYDPAKSLQTKGSYQFIFMRHVYEPTIIINCGIEIDYGHSSYPSQNYTIEAFDKDDTGKIYLLLSTLSGITQQRQYIKLFAERG